MTQWHSDDYEKCFNCADKTHQWNWMLLFLASPPNILFRLVLADKVELRIKISEIVKFISYLSQSWSRLVVDEVANCFCYFNRLRYCARCVSSRRLVGCENKESKPQRWSSRIRKRFNIGFRRSQSTICEHQNYQKCLLSASLLTTVWKLFTRSTLRFKFMPNFFPTWTIFSSAPRSGTFQRHSANTATNISTNNIKTRHSNSSTRSTRATRYRNYFQSTWARRV